MLALYIYRDTNDFNGVNFCQEIIDSWGHYSLKCEVSLMDKAYECSIILYEKKNDFRKAET